MSGILRCGKNVEKIRIPFFGKIFIVFISFISDSEILYKLFLTLPFNIFFLKVNTNSSPLRLLFF